MSIHFQAGLGLALVVLSVLIARWAARYDIKSWLGDAVKRIFFKQRWKEVATKPLAEIDQQLKAQISERVDAFRSDSGRLGHTKAAVKHGGLFALAYVVNMLSTPIFIIGALVLGHAAWRWWG